MRTFSAARTAEGTVGGTEGEGGDMEGARVGAAVAVETGVGAGEGEGEGVGTEGWVGRVSMGPMATPGGAAGLNNVVFWGFEPGYV